MGTDWPSFWFGVSVAFGVLGVITIVVVALATATFLLRNKEQPK